MHCDCTEIEDTLQSLIFNQGIRSNGDCAYCRYAAVGGNLVSGGFGRDGQCFMCHCDASRSRRRTHLLVLVRWHNASSARFKAIKDSKIQFSSKQNDIRQPESQRGSSYYRISLLAA